MEKQIRFYCKKEYSTKLEFNNKIKTKKNLLQI